ncbi:unnamed protein product, partial [Staurois parvus]
MPHISAYQCTSMNCPSELPFSATYQCQSVLPISAIYMSTAFQCPSVMPVNAHQCHLPVQPITAHHGSLI